MKKVHFLYLSMVFMMLFLGETLSSCKKSSSNKNTLSVAGTWNGTAVNTVENDSFSVGFTLKQTDNDITGEFSTEAAPGSVTGVVSGNAVTIILTPAASSGYTEVDTFKGTLNTAGNEITGTFTSTESGISGTFDIKKQ